MLPEWNPDEFDTTTCSLVRLVCTLAGELGGLPRRDLFLDRLLAEGAAVHLRGLVVCELRGSVLICKDSAGFSPEEVSPYRIIPLAANLPLTDTARTSLPLVLGSGEQIAEAYPSLAATTRNYQGALCVYPLTRGGRTYGVLGMSFSVNIAPTELARSALEALAGLTAALTPPETVTLPSDPPDLDGEFSVAGDGNPLAARIDQLESDVRRLTAALSFTSRTTVQYLEG